MTVTIPEPRFYRRGQMRCRLYFSRPKDMADSEHPGCVQMRSQPIVKGLVMAEHATAPVWLEPAQIALRIGELTQQGWLETDPKGVELPTAEVTPEEALGDPSHRPGKDISLDKRLAQLAAATGSARHRIAHQIRAYCGAHYLPIPLEAAKGQARSYSPSQAQGLAKVQTAAPADWEAEREQLLARAQHAEAKAAQAAADLQESERILNLAMAGLDESRQGMHLLGQERDEAKRLLNVAMEGSGEAQALLEAERDARRQAEAEIRAYSASVQSLHRELAEARAQQEQQPEAEPCPDLPHTIRTMRAGIHLVLFHLELEEQPGVYLPHLVRIRTNLEQAIELAGA